MAPEDIKPNWSLAILCICAAASINQTEFSRQVDVNGTIINGLIHSKRGSRLSYNNGSKIERFAQMYLDEEKLDEIGFDKPQNLVSIEALRRESEKDRRFSDGDTKHVVFENIKMDLPHDCMWDLGLEPEQPVSKVTLVGILDWLKKDAKIG